MKKNHFGILVGQDSAYDLVAQNIQNNVEFFTTDTSRVVGVAGVKQGMYSILRERLIKQQLQIVNHLIHTRRHKMIQMQNPQTNHHCWIWGLIRTIQADAPVKLYMNKQQSSIQLDLVDAICLVGITNTIGPVLKQEDAAGDVDD
jgi:hypothetical protein